jgi:16S rRNA (guanine966-N2)-methyltransferase
LRVVGGSARGKPLIMVPGQGTRPIVDRVKTSLFDMLRPRLEGMTALDLFAGTGSVGIEALSQGALFCTFIDLAPRAIATINANLKTTGLGERAEVWQGDGLKFLRSTDRVFDLIYIAPPQYKNLWSDALGRLAQRPELLYTPADDDDERYPGVAIAQIDPKEYVSLDLGSIHEVRRKRYGNTLLVFYERTARELDGERGT